MTRRRTVALLATFVALAVPAAAQPKKPGAGSIRGIVIFEGEAPARPALERDSDPYCAKTETLADDVIVTKGKLKDVLVRIKNGTAGKHAAPATPAVIDQQQCMYTPRVVGLVAGQQLAVRNSDGTFHNVRGHVDGKPLWNKPHPKGAGPLALDASPKAGDVVTVVCDVHPWMKAFAIVQDHPYFAVTGDDGRFEIKGLAPGAYTLEAWHPTLGAKSVAVRIGTGAKASVTARVSYQAN